MKRKLEDNLIDLHINIITNQGAINYTYNRLTAQQKEVVETYVKNMNQAFQKISRDTDSLKELIGVSAKEKGIGVEGITIMSYVESKESNDILIYKNSL